MHRRISSAAAATALAVAVLTVGAVGTAIAATGGSFILGRTNSATTTTTLNNTKGIPLSLVAPRGKPPLSVSQNAKVANLNADLLDGLDSSAFERVATATLSLADHPAPAPNSDLIAVGPYGTLQVACDSSSGEVQLYYVKPASLSSVDVVVEHTNSGATSVVASSYSSDTLIGVEFGAGRFVLEFGGGSRVVTATVALAYNQSVSPNGCVALAQVL